MSSTNLFVEIGNTDNKLKQDEWSDFCHDVEQIVDAHATRVYGKYYSHTNTPYQNACFHFEIDGTTFNYVEKALGRVCDKYEQESIALTQGDTVFVSGEDRF